MSQYTSEDYFHTNPSRRKIPYPPCKRGFTFGEGKQCSKQNKHQNSFANLSQLGCTPTHQNSLSSFMDTTMQQHQHLLDDNRYLKKQLKQLRGTNHTLLDRLEEKERELVRADSEYRLLVLQVSNQLNKTNSNIRNMALDQSKITHKKEDLLRVPNHSYLENSASKDNSVSNVSRSDLSRRSRSKENLVKIKQIFDDLDFKEVERIASTKKRKKIGS